MDEVYNAWEFVNKDGSEALVSVVATKRYANEAPVYLKLRGLKEDKTYSLNGSSYLGAALMYAGFLMPEASEEYQSWNFHLKEM